MYMYDLVDGYTQKKQDSIFLNTVHFLRLDIILDLSDHCHNLAHDHKKSLYSVHLVQHQYPKRDRKSTRLNSSHVAISYAVFCLKKKTDGHISPLGVDISTTCT